MKEQDLISQLKFQIKNGGMTIKLIAINVFVFLIISLLEIIARLSLNTEIISIIRIIFGLNTDLNEFLYTPWGLFTSIFSHFSFFHILFNMLMLYFSGKMFEQFLGEKKLLVAYFFGGILGGVFEILANNIFLSLSSTSILVVGASGSIMAIFTAIAFYRPNLKISLFGLFEMPIYFLAILYILHDIFSIGIADGVAHFAHLGGIIFGLFISRNPHHGLLSSLSNFIDKLLSVFKRNKLNVVHKKVRNMSDEDFNIDKKEKQERINLILDKITKSGYDSLSKAEKDFLFKQSK